MRILLAEDDSMLGDGLRAGLRQAGFQVDWVRDGVAAERELRAVDYAAAVLDLGLPGKDGMEVLQALRAARIVYEEVDFAWERGREGINGCDIRDITDKRCPTDFLGEGFDTVCAAGGAPDVVTGCGEGFGGGGSDTAGRAGNNSNWACGHASILPEVGVAPPRGEDEITLLVTTPNVGP